MGAFHDHNKIISGSGSRKPICPPDLQPQMSYICNPMHTTGELTQRNCPHQAVLLHTIDFTESHPNPDGCSELPREAPWPSEHPKSTSDQTFHFTRGKRTQLSLHFSSPPTILLSTNVLSTNVAATHLMPTEIPNLGCG